MLFKRALQGALVCRLSATAFTMRTHKGPGHLYWGTGLAAAGYFAPKRALRAASLTATTAGWRSLRSTVMA